MRYIITYFTKFKSYAFQEIRKVDRQAKGRKLTTMTMLIESEMERKDFIQELVNSKPIFIRHIMPVEKEFMLSNRREIDLEQIIEESKPICSVQKGDPFSVQARVVAETGDYNSKDIEVHVGEYYEANGGVAVYSNEKLMNCEVSVISVFIKGQRCFIGYSKSSENLNYLSDEYRLLSHEQNEICRAENKLKEAICKFHIDIKGQGCALDVGAAPGGWTKVLADYGYQVVAVDPGDLDERLKAYDNITHYKKRIEDVDVHNMFNLVTCDMNQDALVTANMMCQMHDKIKEHGYSIITLKLPFRDEVERIQKSIMILNKDYDIIDVKNLTHNRREVTVFMQSK